MKYISLFKHCVFTQELKQLNGAKQSLAHVNMQLLSSEFLPYIQVHRITLL